MKLDYAFYNRNVVEVAQDLLGKTLVFGNHQGIITETEAYRGGDDEASHAYRGITKRSAMMYGPPGYTYIYIIYGMYYCLNVVTEAEHSPSAVLIRGLELPGVHLNGPGKICKYLGLNKEHNGIHLISNSELYLTDGIQVTEYKTTTRIGIRKAIDKKWRFLL